MSYISGGGSGGGGGTPGGAPGQLQYQVNASTFGGIADYTSDGTNILGGGGIVGGPFQIEPLLVEATGNLTLYFATTGSDVTGNGSSGNPYATPAHAFFIASQFDFQSLYQCTVNGANGTYTQTETLLLPKLTNCVQANFIGNSGSPSSVVISSQSIGINPAIIVEGGTWVVDGFEIDAQFEHLWPQGGSNVQVNNLAHNDSSGGGFSQPYTVSGTSALTFNGSLSTVTILQSTIFSFAQTLNYGSADFSTINVVFPAALSISAYFFSITGYTSVTWGNGITYTNFGGVTGVQLDMDVFSSLLTDNGALSDIPGNGGFAARDQTCSWTSIASNVFAQFYGDFSGTPSSSQIGTQLWAILKDSGQSAGFGTKIVLNDAGTVATIGPIGKFLVSGLPTGMTAGTKAFVTDALGPVFAATLTGGGGVFCPVYYDGTNWRAG